MKDYNADSIEVLEGLDPVRKRPGMYTETNRPNHLAQEVIDNAVDEGMGGYANHVIVTLHSDGSLSVKDNGRGMPLDMHKKKRKPAYEVILTTLHSGGKFSGNSYGYSGGLHGVGVSVVNALSKHLELTIWRDQKTVKATFKNGKKKEEEAGSHHGEEQGTMLRFWPDESFFETSRFHRPSIQSLLKSKAVLCSGLRIDLIDEEVGSEESWCYENGLEDYFRERQAEAVDPLPATGWGIESKWETGECQTAFSFSSDGHSVMSDSFANLIPTPQGGTHVQAVKQGVAQAVRQVGETRSLLPKNVNLTQDDITYNLNLLVSIKVKEPQFAGQTKEKLSNREFISELASQTRDRTEQLLNQSPDIAEQIIQHAIDRALARTKASKKVARKKATSGLTLPGKLADCSQADAKTAELFLVEGDSAGGSAKQARDRTFQAILPLRGKIKNTWEDPTEEILDSQEISNIATSVGMDPNSEDMTGLRYNKVCILADADSDGLHIATLLCALFLKHFEPFVRKGHLYIAIPPLYRIDLGKKVFYAMDEREKNDILLKLTKQKGTPNVQRFKGLGEMNPDQLTETVMDPAHRNLVQIRVDDIDATNGHMSMLLEKKRANSRKAWLESTGDQADID